MHFSDFSMQLLKLHSRLGGSWLCLISYLHFDMHVFFSYINFFSLIHSTQEHLNPQMTSSHLWFHSSVGLRALHHHCEVTGSNLIEVLNFSVFSTQLLKIVFKTERIIASLDIISYHHRS